MNTFFFDDVQYPEGLFGGKDFFNPIIYSTEERKVGVWTNGKPLYAKTFIQQLSGNAGQVDISACGADMMFAHSGYYDIGVTMLGLNERLNNQYLTYTHVNVDTMQYIDCTNTIASNSTIVVCCLYTKTADVAGSGSYNTLGVPTVHYSTDEQVIGTWTDGKPLYQKTLKSNSGIPRNSWVTIINDSNIRIKNYYGYIYYTANLEDGSKYPLDWYIGASRYYSCTECNGGTLEVLQDVTTSYGYDVTIQYTKTTD